MSKKEKPDPTINVQNMLREAVARMDDLREAEVRRVNEQIEAERRRVNEQLTLRAEYNAQLAVAEAKRIDAIRAVDVNAVAVANERATAQAAVLATQVSASAETLRSLVAATAATVAQQLVQMSAQFTDRLSSLEKAQYESKGSSGGSQNLWSWIVGAVVAIVAVMSFILPHLK